MAGPAVQDLPDPLRVSQLRELLAQAGLQPRRRDGQNFLVDRQVRDRIVAAAELLPTDAVFEVGPGAGALTLGLLGRCAVVVAVEKDKGLAAVLARQLPPTAPVTIITADALTVPWAETLRRAAREHGVTPGRLLFISNLPYSITGPALAHLLVREPDFSQAVVMVQREVGQRLAAGPGTKAYGSLTLLAQYHAEVKGLFTVAPGSFWPRPAVASMVIGLTRRSEPPVQADADDLFAVVRAAFAQRRKMLRNALAAGLSRAPAEIAAALAEAAVDGSRRGETLSLSEFARLAQHLPGAAGGGSS